MKKHEKAICEQSWKSLPGIIAFLLGLHIASLPVMAVDIQVSAGRDTPIPSARRRVIERTMPDYPADLDVKERQGKLEVMLRIFISPDGQVEKAEVEKTSGIEELDERTIAAVGRWKYEATGAAETSLVKVVYSTHDSRTMASVGMIFEQISRRSARARIDMAIRLMRRTPAARGVHWIAETGGRELPTVATYQILVSEQGEVTDVEMENSSRVWLDDAADSILKETKYQPFSEPTRQYMTIKIDPDSPPNVFIIDVTGEAPSFDGVWQSTMGLLYLKQVGAEITGVCSPGRGLSIKGTAFGDKCTFKYDGAGSGADSACEGWFRLSNDSHTLRGKHKAVRSKKWVKWDGTRATTWNDVAIELSKHKRVHPPQEKKKEKRTGVVKRKYWLPDPDDFLEDPVALSDTLAEFVRDMEKMYTLFLDGAYDDREEYTPMWDHWVRLRKLAHDIGATKSYMALPVAMDIRFIPYRDQVNRLNEKLNAERLHLEAAHHALHGEKEHPEARRGNHQYLSVWLGELSLRREFSIEGSKKIFVSIKRMPLRGITDAKFQKAYPHQKIATILGYADDSGKKFVVDEDLQRNSAYHYAFLADGLEQEGIDISQYSTWSELRRASDFVKKHFKFDISDFDGGCWLKVIHQYWKSGGKDYFELERAVMNVTDRLTLLMVNSTAVHEMAHLMDTAKRVPYEREAIAYCAQLYGGPIVFHTLRKMEGNIRTQNPRHGRACKWIFDEMLKMMTSVNHKPDLLFLYGVTFDDDRSGDKYLPLLELKETEINTYAYRLLQAFAGHEKIMRAFKRD